MIRLLTWYAVKKGSDSKYPQTWNLMPKRWIECKNEFYPNGQRKLRRARLRLALEWFCGVLIGHEISETERGYNGGRYIDCNCRWCDKSFQIPVEEASKSRWLVDFFKEIKRDGSE